MQPNTLAAPRQLMQDVTPPYAKAADIRPAQAVPVAREAETAPVIPVAQPTTPAPLQPTAAAVHEQPAPASPPAPHQIQQTPAKMEPASLAKTKTNWLIIVLALAVSAGLMYAAYLAYRPH